MKFLYRGSNAAATPYNDHTTAINQNTDILAGDPMAYSLYIFSNTNPKNMNPQ